MLSERGQREIHSERANNRDKNQSSDIQEQQVKRRLIQRGRREIAGVMERFYILTVVVVTQLYMFLKIQRTILLERMVYPICKLYKNKPDL